MGGGRRNVRMRAGYVRGRHFTEYVDTVKDLKRTSRLEKLEELLVELIDATEAEDRKRRWGVAPWYYEEAAKLYRKLKNHGREVAILERFARQRHAPGVSPARLLQRLEKARKLLVESQE